MEVIAAVSAVVGVGQPIVSTIFQVVRAKSQIKDIPEQITDLLVHLQAMTPLIAEMESNFANRVFPLEEWNPSAANPGIERCREASLDLTAVATKFEQALSTKRGMKRAAMSAKILFKKDELATLENRLRRALDLLNLAMNLYRM